MEIKTKYDPGQSVFHMDNNKVNESAIERISIEIRYKMDGITVKPFYRLFSKNTWYEENELFPTKEELLKSL